MKLTSNIIPEDKQDVQEYPCLMRHSTEGFVVLFVREGEGTVVYSPASTEAKVGYFSHCWLERKFEPFYGLVQLEMGES